MTSEDATNRLLAAVVWRVRTGPGIRRHIASSTDQKWNYGHGSSPATSSDVCVGGQD